MIVEPSASFRSVPDLWHHRIGSTPEAPALRYREGSGWVTLDWAEAGRRVEAIAGGLLARGLQPGDRVAILADTCVEWILADLAVLCAGGATTAIYPRSPRADLSFILDDSGARFVFTDHVEHARRVSELQAGAVEAVILMGPSAEDDVEDDDDGLVALPRLEREGRDHLARHASAYREAHQRVAPDDVATLMYTSGTTGRPRGVVLTHDAWLYEAEAIDALGALSPADVQLLWLPLSHVFAKVLQLTFVRLGIATAVDGRPDALLPNLREVRPTFLAAVPRTFERLRRALEREAEARPLGGRLTRAALDAAVHVGRRTNELRRAGRTVPPPLRLQHAVTDRLVARPIRERLGGRLRFVISGGAPLPADVAAWFDALGICILEGYGLTESAAASCVNRPDDVRLGTVGPPLPGCDVRVDADGEIQIRSRGLMRGYWRDAEATEAAFTADGFLRTGDLGRLHSGGHLEITGRIKDILVTSGGKNVAPRRMEEKLRVRCPYVEHVVMVGDGRPWCAALVTLEPRAITAWARERELAFPDVRDLAAHPQVIELIEGYLAEVNRELAAFERVRRIAVIGDAWTEAEGLLTPSQKVRRHAVEARYAEVVDRLYRPSGAAARPRTRRAGA